MSERPQTCAGIISQILGIDWGDDPGQEKAREACRKVIEQRPELRDFCDEAIKIHHNESEWIEGMKSWRDVRNFAVSDRFDKEFKPHVILQEVQDELGKMEDG